MRAVQFSRFGAPHEVAEVVDLPEPTLRPGHVLVALEASPINPADLLNQPNLLLQLARREGYKPKHRIDPPRYVDTDKEWP